MITTFAQLSTIRQAHQGKRIVFKGGCFDLLHEGHIRSLNYSKSLGDIVVIGIVTDERVRQRKGPYRPIHEENDRLAVMDAFRAVDYVFLMPLPAENLPTPTMRVIEQLRPDFFVEHVSNESRWSPEDIGLLAQFGTELAFDPGFKRDSTSDIIKRILAGQEAE